MLRAPKRVHGKSKTRIAQGHRLVESRRAIRLGQCARRRQAKSSKIVGASPCSYREIGSPAARDHDVRQSPCAGGVVGAAEMRQENGSADSRAAPSIDAKSRIGIAEKLAVPVSPSAARIGDGTKGTQFDDRAFTRTERCIDGE